MNAYVMAGPSLFSDDTRRDEASGDLFERRRPNPGGMARSNSSSCGTPGPEHQGQTFDGCSYSWRASFPGFACLAWRLTLAPVSHGGPQHWHTCLYSRPRGSKYQCQYARTETFTTADRLEASEGDTRDTRFRLFVYKFIRLELEMNTYGMVERRSFSDEASGDLFEPQHQGRNTGPEF